MRSQTGSVLPSVVVRASAVCVLALGVSACSSDTMRFTETPFSSPFKTAEAPSTTRDPVTTGSIGRAAGTPVASVPSVSNVRSQPLPPPQSAVALRNAAPVAVAGSAAGWSAQGGTPIVVAEGETLDMISSRYGVPRAALISTNGLSSGTVAPGSRLTIPVYNAAAAAAPAPAPRQVAQTSQVVSDAAPSPAPARTLAPPPSTLAASRPAAPLQDARAKAQSQAEAKAQAAAEAKRVAEAKAAAAAEAKAKAAADAQAMRDARAKFAAEAKAKAENRKAAAAAPAPTPAPAPAAKPAVAAKPAPEKAKPVVVASAPAAEPKATAIPKSAPEPTPVPEPKTTASLPKAEPESASEKNDFRWPARGRVISGFSGKGGNEGINIAVPEGTPIKAAEGGTVAYAGNELKGYGNLVLIRHPNGYVSAYAHNGSLNVKRGDTIKRGQVVATAGQTGNVSSPQLHFELRKGSTPVDPTPYLNN
jgi:murein DD-endopeptidase MepM/ murein hydrolase activator NlpD